MTGELGAAGWVVLGLAGLWLAAAAALLVIALRRLRDAGEVLGVAANLQSLLDAAPARPLLVRGDGSMEIDARLARDLGFDTPPSRLEALQGSNVGIEPDDLAALQAAVREASAVGGRMELKLRSAGAAKVFQVRGAPAPAPEPVGSMLLWFSDTSSAEAERAELRARLERTESALENLTYLIEASPFPTWYRGPDLKLGLVNRAYVEAVEAKDAADVVARSIELIDLPGPDGARAGAEAALKSGKPLERVQPATIGGERRMLRIVDVPLKSGAVVSFAIDIQDLEDARAELARHVRSQRDLADRMTAGAVQFDPDRSLASFNRPFAAMAQLEPEWLSEGPEFDRVLERMRENHRVPEVRDFPAWKAERRLWFTQPDEVIEEEWILPGGDHVRVVAQPLPDGGLRIFFEDRTEQVRLASARDTLLRVRAATFDNLFEAIGVFASDGRLYLWNRRFAEVWDLEEEWLSGHPRIDELVPAIARKLVNPTNAARIREMVRHTTSERQRASERISLTDGRRFEFASVPLPDGNALFTMVDVTDSSRIEAALRERAKALEDADRVKTAFVANVSYELRTPLTSISGFAEMLANGYAGKLTSTAAEYIEAILQSVSRLSKLIDDVLDLTQSDTNTLTLERERVDVGGLCRTAVERIRPRAEEKRQTLELAVAEEAGHLIGDARRLRDSIEHVLSNAVAFTDTGGRIRLAAEGDEERATIRVEDNGVGIADGDLPHVFDRFARIDDAGVRGEAALGLGLPLTRQFIEAHGGTVELSSRKGEGTVVVLSIPRQAP
jgi:signal transduction histidine kinase